MNFKARDYLIQKKKRAGRLRTGHTTVVKLNALISLPTASTLTNQGHLQKEMNLARNYEEGRDIGRF